MNFDVAVLTVASLAVVAVVVLTIVMVRGRIRNGEDALSGALAEMNVALAGREGSLDAKVSELDSKLASLQEAMTSREATLDEQVRGMGAQMQGITNLFSNDRARGGWGEISMLRIFEMGGLVEGRDYTPQFHAGDRTPDAVVHVPGGRNIVIDSKFPVARYVEALAVEDAEQRHSLLVEQGKELRRVGKSLIDKGYRELASGGYVVIYLPSQAVYEAAAEAHPEVIERLLEKRVIVAGPTALFALLLNVASLMTEHRALQQADQILDEAKELHRRMSVFVTHLQSVGAALGRTVEGFNAAVGSWTSRVAPQLTRVTDLTGQSDHEPVEPIDDAVREIEADAYALLSAPAQN
ncbi:MAG: DNA recombination protein RmuC [Acidobacteria bacterium]|nr:DNA recombination protein RmuC [Acidobacteriota bacterium]